MLPELIDNTNFRYIQVGSKYMASISIVKLPEVIYFMDVIKDLNKSISWDLSLNILKQDTFKFLNSISYNLATQKSELMVSNNNQKNLDIVSKGYDDAKELRYKIQIENEEIYSVTFVITIAEDNITKVLKLLNSFKARLYSRGIVSNILNFRHLEGYLDTLPLGLLPDTITNKLTLTTSALSNIFPFYSNTFLDSDGVIIGTTKDNNKLCNVNIFGSNYQNANMCILGSSGSGKSYFTKLFVLRNFFKNTIQIIIDAEDEYIDICSKLKGQVVDYHSSFNVLQIFKSEILEDNFLNFKIQNIATFIHELSNIPKHILISKIQDLYSKYNISDRESLLKKSENSKILIEEEMIDTFPTLRELNVDISFPNILDKTNIDLNNNLFIIRTKGIDVDNIYLFLNFLLDNFKLDKKIIIYIDEMWKNTRGEKGLESIAKLYKTIRKRNGSIISITQDLTDFFEKDNGKFANNILNNSCFKVIFKTEFEDTKVLSSVINIDPEKIAILKKGEAFFCINKNHAQISVKANSFEEEIINENNNNNK